MCASRHTAKEVWLVQASWGRVNKQAPLASLVRMGAHAQEAASSVRPSPAGMHSSVAFQTPLSLLLELSSW